jgi:small-conductance mechanosensitive channel
MDYIFYILGRYETFLINLAIAIVIFLFFFMLRTIFGGIVIITDKPFSIGYWIETPSVEGTVEDINFRSTTVRTFADPVVNVPNNTLANEPVTNWTRLFSQTEQIICTQNDSIAYSKTNFSSPTAL